MLYSVEKSILQKLDLEELKDQNVEVWVKRDDLIDKDVSGNKWRKLKYNIEQAMSQHKLGILTFGGAFSNHLVATAAACYKAGILSIGIVRGDELNKYSNETLKHCDELGMHLVFVSRDEYSLRNEKSYKEQLSYKYPNMYIVPEGGANFYGMIGCQEIMSELDLVFDAVFVAQGTTTTSCGILLSLPDKTNLHVVPVLKNYDSLGEMKGLLNYSLFDEGLTDELLQKVNVISDAHFGGYGKYNNELLTFIKKFYQRTQIPLDPVYTGKVMFAIMRSVQNGDLKNKKVLFIHTGGIQGAGAIAKKEGTNLYD